MKVYSKKIGILLLSESLLGFPNGSETLREFPIVTKYLFVSECSLYMNVKRSIYSHSNFSKHFFAAFLNK
jgi:hypothetical protein